MQDHTHTASYSSLNSNDLERLDNEIALLDRFQVLSAKSIVCDYMQLEKHLKQRNPFRGIRHYVQAVVLRDNGSIEVDLVTLRLVGNLYSELA